MNTTDECNSSRTGGKVDRGGRSEKRDSDNDGYNVGNRINDIQRSGV